MKALTTDTSGKNPKMILNEVQTPEPGDYELLVKVEAASLNRADLLQKKGKYPPPKNASPILGLEMAGVVEKVGFQVTRYEPGDYVFGLLTGGGYAEYCTIHERMAMNKPEDFSFEEAAAVPEVFLTAFQALKYLGNIKKNETVLIHAGASGVGTAAIQLAKQLFSARVITTASKKNKLDACKDLGADLAINYKKQDFNTVIKEELGKNSVDLIIDFVGAPYWEQNIDILALDGCIIYLSMLGGSEIPKADLLPILRKRLQIKGSTLRNRSDEYKMRLTSDFHSYAMELLETGDIKPVIDKIYNWEDAEEAHKRMEKNKNIGKIVLSGM
ncbi:MAG TPA: NAD(P)H-quinone oxidoreductase [Balneolaceae bacterium]|nr:NAD(P)H-quinone oxidoreductase [Balneolaceae bacterium]